MKHETPMMSDIEWLSASEIADAVHARKLSAVDVTNQVLARIEGVGATLNAFTDVVSERARANARKIDVLIAGGVMG